MMESLFTDTQLKYLMKLPNSNTQFSNYLIPLALFSERGYMVFEIKLMNAI